MIKNQKPIRMKKIPLKPVTKIATFLLSITCATSLWAEENEVKFADLPANVQKAATAIMKGGKVKEVEIEKEKGKTQYEIEFLKGGKEVSIKFDSAGNLSETETKMELKEAPKPVQATIKKEMGEKGELEELEKEVKKGKTVYKVEIEIGKKEIKLHLDPSGKILKKKVEDDD